MEGSNGALWYDHAVILIYILLSLTVEIVFILLRCVFPLMQNDAVHLLSIFLAFFYIVIGGGNRAGKGGCLLPNYLYPKVSTH